MGLKPKTPQLCAGIRIEPATHDVITLEHARRVNTNGGGKRATNVGRRYDRNAGRRYDRNAAALTRPSVELNTGGWDSAGVMVSIFMYGTLLRVFSNVPPMSVPIAIGTAREATSAASPPEEPPGVRVLSYLVAGDGVGGQRAR